VSLVTPAVSGQRSVDNRDKAGITTEYLTSKPPKMHNRAKQSTEKSYMIRTLHVNYSISKRLLTENNTVTHATTNLYSLFVFCATPFLVIKETELN